MAIGILKNVKIACIACALPKNKVLNDYFVKHYGEKFVKRFEHSTGITERYWVHKKQTASDLCYVAAQKVLEKKGWSGKDIDALIFISQTPDYKTPSTAFVLHKRLGMREDAIVFDINMGCTAVIHGIVVLASMIKSNAVRNGMILIGDALPERKVTEDHNESMMFSDAGSALLLEKGESGEIPYLVGSDGNGFQAIMNPQGERFPINMESLDWRICKHYMNGEQVFNFATSVVPDAFKKYTKHFRIDSDGLDYFVFHQANRFIIRHIANDMRLSEERVPLSIEHYANTNGASILVTIVDMMERGDLESLKHIAICGFGIGLSWGIMDFYIDKGSVLPMIFTDEYYKDGTDIQYLSNH